MSENNKRRRLQKTSHSQYEEYLKLMEEDQIFRTGIINPTIDPHHIENCWEQLTTRLNATGNGPVLSSAEWKKRFNDWKNSTRAKYRKNAEERRRTGGGKSAAVLLTPLEERGLSVWGRVTVTGTPKLSLTGGFPRKAEVEEIPQALNEDAEVPEVENIEPDNSETSVHSSPHARKESQLQDRQKHVKFPRRSVSSARKKSNRSVRSIGEEFLTAYKENSLENEKRKLELEERRIVLEEKKLEFEIAKYKFENPNFILN